MRPSAALPSVGGAEDWMSAQLCLSPAHCCAMELLMGSSLPFDLRVSWLLGHGLNLVHR